MAGKPPQAVPGFSDITPMEHAYTQASLSTSEDLVHPYGFAYGLGAYTNLPNITETSTSRPLRVQIRTDIQGITIVPPVYTFSQPNPTVMTTTFNSLIDIERPVKNAEHEDMARKMKSLEQAMKNLQGLGGYKSVSFRDLCMFPDVHLSLGFKSPKFEKCDGHGDPVAHLKKYCNQLRGAGGKQELLMANFGECFTGLALEWFIDQDITKWHIWDDMAQEFVQQFQYNKDLVPDAGFSDITCMRNFWSDFKTWSSQGTNALKIVKKNI
ncbi:uncharacterized protein LOC132034572 [Lycium ferocissimum]|uniref:uncharacterized protein LOC132034572 n=1 Tax=Lycium ferocissimum TaxID=112874 RepID=UPI00281569C6|nr:uncharacterized protein LOC132034572 [Lycium ferocissimum]